MSRHSRLVARGVAAVLALSAPALAQNMDFGISNDAEYTEFTSAIGASEYVRYDYTLSRNPRAVAVVAGLLEFATRNPLAGESELQTFLDEFDNALATFDPGDAVLQRGANFLPAVQHARIPDTIDELNGFDTHVGARVLELLGADVPDPLDWDSLGSRMVQFDRSRLRSFAHTREWSNLLVIAFMGRDLDANPRPDVTPVIQAYLESLGYEPVPDGIDDGRFAMVNAGLAQLPPDYASYVTAITCPPGAETPPIWTGIADQFGVISAVTDQRLTDIQNALATEPSLIEGVSNAQAPGYLDQLRMNLQAQLDEVATPRTIISARSLLMFQNGDAGIRQLAQQAQDFSCIQLETNETMNGIGAGVNAVVGVAAIGLGIAQISTGVGALTGAVTIVGGVAALASGTFGLLDAFGVQIGEPTPSADQQILDQVVAVREDIENMRQQMNFRFDRIEVKLNLIYEGIATGFNQIAEQLDDLSIDVAALTREVIVVHATLERIEEALYAMAEDLLQSTLQSDVNLYLNYRPANGVDLPYTSGGAQNFLTAANSFFTYCVDVAKNQTFAGPNTSSLSVANAAETLNNDSIGRNVNDLRVFPFQHLGLPALLANRTVAPGPWSQGAAAYVQLARENPWYFAYQYEQQLITRGVLPDVERIIAEGRALADSAANGRSQELFDALFDGYNQTVEQMDDLIKQLYIAENIIPSWWHDDSVVIDPLAGVNQNVNDLAWEINGPESRCNNDIRLGSVFKQSTIYWDLFLSGAPALHVIVADGGFPEFLGSPSGLTIAYFENECFNDMARREITWQFDPEPAVMDPCFDAYLSEQWDCGTLQAALLSGENLAGQTINLPACNVYPATDLHILTDTHENLAGFCGDPVVDTLEQQILDQLDPYVNPALDEIIAELEAPASTLKDLTGVLTDWESLIEAYATFALPELMEYSSIARAGLNGDPQTGELVLRGEALLPALQRMRNGTDPVNSVQNLLKQRSEILQNEINDALQIPHQGHSYINWMLAELTTLRDEAFHLATDDAYATPVGQTLMVAATLSPGDECQNEYLTGLIANDVDQPCRTVEVDTTFSPADGYVPPMHGTVNVGADGSFTYTPDPGFEGVDSFTYRIGASVVDGAQRGELDQFVHSSPAWVRIVVGDPSAPACEGDVDGNGAVEIPDITYVIFRLGDSGTPGNVDGDADGDGMVTIPDITYVIFRLGTCQ